jgi:uncharacterized protein YbcI
MTASTEIRGGELNAAVTREVIGVHVEVAGRGPDRAYSVHQGDLLISVLEGTMTAGERRLARHGRGEEVRAMKRHFQRLMEPDLRQRVEGVTGRRILALLGDSHLDPDLIVTVFVLCPDPAEAEKRIGNGAR